MKKLKLLLFATACIFNIQVQAQIQDSTNIGWTAATVYTWLPAPPIGTRCGSTAYDTRFNGRPQDGAINGVIHANTMCQGHVPYVSCPAGYDRGGSGESGQGMWFFSCIKN
jgi:hypothetical protein